MIIDQHIYRKAFQNYLKTGAPILRGVKQDRPTTHYIWRNIWRTRRDSRVRSAHADREGQIYSWDNPPEGGHPGEDYGCRCTAEPVKTSQSEKIEHELIGVSDSGARWENHDAVWHFYFGDGATVNLAEIGHLSEIAHHWAYTLGVLEIWTEQIMKKALESNGQFTHDFGNSYSFRGIEFFHGSSVVSGMFKGNVTHINGWMYIEGETHYEFSDIFTDPVDVRGFAAWIAEKPNRIRRLFQVGLNIIGWRDGPLTPELNLDPNNVSDLIKAITDIGGTAFSIRGSWTSKLSAIIAS